MANKLWTDDAWREYLYWQDTDRKLVKKINDLIKDINRNGPMKGLGKPEALRHIKAYSRRITDGHRLVYIVDEKGTIVILSCAGHYSDK